MQSSSSVRLFVCFALMPSHTASCSKIISSLSMTRISSVYYNTNSALLPFKFASFPPFPTSRHCCMLSRPSSSCCKAPPGPPGCPPPRLSAFACRRCRQPRPSKPLRCRRRRHRRIRRLRITLPLAVVFLGPTHQMLRMSAASLLRHLQSLSAQERNRARQRRTSPQRRVRPRRQDLRQQPH